MKKLGLAMLVTLAVVIVLVVAVPNTTLAWVRGDFRWIGRAVNWVEALRPGWDTVHILLFGVLGMLARLTLPRTPWPRLLLGLTVFAATTEVLQFWAPGRTPRITDFAQDVVGAAMGVFLVLILQALWTRWHNNPLRP
jgi:hypothetical protein